MIRPSARRTVAMAAAALAAPIGAPGPAHAAAEASLVFTALAGVDQGCSPHDMNNAGDVLTVCGDRASILRAGRQVALDASWSGGTIAVTAPALGDSGIVADVAECTPIGAKPHPCLVRWSREGGATVSSAAMSGRHDVVDVGPHGDVVIDAGGADNTGGAVWWADGALTSIAPSEAGQVTQPLAIDTQGTVYGSESPKTAGKPRIGRDKGVATHATRTPRGGTTTRLAGPTTGDHGSVTAVSPDGSWIVGTARPPGAPATKNTAVRYRVGGVATALPRMAAAADWLPTHVNNRGTVLASHLPSSTSGMVRDGGATAFTPATVADLVEGQSVTALALTDDDRVLVVTASPDGKVTSSGLITRRPAGGRVMPSTAPTTDHVFTPSSTLPSGCRGRDGNAAGDLVMECAGVVSLLRRGKAPTALPHVYDGGSLSAATGPQLGPTGAVATVATCTPTGGAPVSCLARWSADQSLVVLAGATRPFHRVADVNSHGDAVVTARGSEPPCGSRNAVKRPVSRGWALAITGRSSPRHPTPPLGR